MYNYQASFFLTELTSADIFQYLEDVLRVPYEANLQNNSVLLDGVADSRYPSSRCLLFTEGGCKEVISRSSDCFILAQVLPEETTSNQNNIICRVPDPRAVFIDLVAYLAREIRFSPFHRGHLENALIDDSVKVEEGCTIESGVMIGKGSVVRSGAVLRTGTLIGEFCSIGENCCIGNDGITVYKAKDGRLLNFPHVGGVRIGRGTQIGANTVIPRGIIASTLIGEEVVIGNLCNIGHSCKIGDGVWMSVGTYIGGHTVVKEGVTLGMGARLRDNLTVGAHAAVGMGTVVVKNIEAGWSVFGNPAKRMPKLATGPVRS